MRNPTLGGRLSKVKKILKRSSHKLGVMTSSRCQEINLNSSVKKSETGIITQTLVSSMVIIGSSRIFTYNTTMKMIKLSLTQIQIFNHFAFLKSLEELNFLLRLMGKLCTINRRARKEIAERELPKVISCQTPPYTT